MRLDKYSNPIFNEQEIFDALYQGYQIDPSDFLFVQHTKDIWTLEEQLGFKLAEPVDELISVQEFDSIMQHNWNMPDEYKTLDIEEWLISQCPPWGPESTRLAEELEAYKARNMLDLLRWLKYFVDTCSKENILWGVGRGSSVASYVLYLIGVHNIDPIKYNLDWQEFLR